MTQPTISNSFLASLIPIRYFSPETFDPTVKIGEIPFETTGGKEIISIIKAYKYIPPTYRNKIHLTVAENAVYKFRRYGTVMSFYLYVRGNCFTLHLDGRRLGTRGRKVYSK